MMRASLNSLKRLKSFYGLQERQRFAELQKCNGEVNRAAEAIEVQTEIVQTASLKEHEAVIAGDREDAALSAVMKEIAIQRRQALERILRDREERRKAARERYLTSQMKPEKVQILLDIAEGQARIERERKEQAHAADGFLSRMRWNEKRHMPGGSDEVDLIK